MAFNYAADMEKIEYTSGSIEFTNGETLTGATSGATSEVIDWTLDSGTWSGGDAAGSVYVKTVTGTYQAENLNGSTGGDNMATAGGASVAEYSSLNRLRNLIGDIDPSYPLFTDAELEAIITKCTTDGVVDFRLARGILLRVLSVDAVRLVQSRKATAGGVRLVEEMNQYAAMAETLLS